VGVKNEEEPLDPVASPSDSTLPPSPNEKSLSWKDRRVVFVKYACLEATSERDKTFIFCRWVK
jgi:hypothetical protein